MAIVKGPALSLDASGNLGSICYTKIRSTNIARAAWTGTVPNTSDQVVIQGYMTDVSQAWGGTLSETDRQSWREKAKTEIRVNRLGVKYNITGYQFFMQINMALRTWELSIRNTPPVDLEPYFIKEMTISSLLSSEIRVALLMYNSITALKGTQWFIAGPYSSPGRNPIKPEFRQIAVRFGTFGVSLRETGFDIGSYYWVKVRGINKSGIHSGFWQMQILVT